MENSLLCPKCGEIIEISQVLRKQIEGKLEKSLEEKYKKELEDVQRKTEERIRKKVEDEILTEQKDLKKQLLEKEEKISEFRENELKLREEKRKIEEEKKELKLEVQRQLDQERKKIEETTFKQAYEEHRLKDLEKEKLINDLKKSLEDAQRKAKQGSQQLQGEVLELDIEEMLRQSFKGDIIEPVAKGVVGADIKHTVKSPKGFTCGIILWELKRTKAWSDSWIAKLKADLRSEKANIPVIISQVLPPEAKNGMGLIDGVWVCGLSLILPLATLLRNGLVDIYFQKAVVKYKGDKASLLYEYITGHEFRQQVEALAEVIFEMNTQIQKERVAFEKIWKSRESQIKRIALSSVNVIGSMQGLIGTSVLKIKGFDLLELESGT